MPTNTNAYNSRVTDESLEKRFRDTFRSQGGAELVDDLYAQGVIVPIVDFTAAATGQQLAQNLQTAWDISTASFNRTTTGSTAITTTAGFYEVNYEFTVRHGFTTPDVGSITLTDGFTTKTLVSLTGLSSGSAVDFENESGYIVAFVNSGETLQLTTVGANSSKCHIRQIATVNGDLVNPTGFTSS